MAKRSLHSEAETSKEVVDGSKADSEPEIAAEVALVAKSDVVEEVLSLKKSWSEKRDAAIAELLRRRDEIAAQLAELDYHDQSSEPDWMKPASARPVRKVRVQKKSVKKAKTSSARIKFCPVCNMDTNHDGRAHRSQGKKKKAFTPEEIEALA